MIAMSQNKPSHPKYLDWFAKFSAGILGFSFLSFLGHLIAAYTQLRWGLVQGILLLSLVGLAVFACFSIMDMWRYRQGYFTKKDFHVALVPVATAATVLLLAIGYGLIVGG